MKQQLSSDPAYNRAHYAARRILNQVCESCGSDKRVQAALRPETPSVRLLMDPRTGCLYSLTPSDYFPLCVACHKKMDAVEMRPHCKHGHSYTPENTSVKKDGSRRCLTCHREQERRRLLDSAKRKAKDTYDREYRLRNPMTPEQKARKIALQRLRRSRKYSPTGF